MGLIVALAPESRWGLGWHRNAAIRAERNSDRLTAALHWEAIAETADPTKPVDAVFVENAARFRLRQHDYVGARSLLSAAAPALAKAKIYRDVGVLLAQHEPRDDRAALQAWDQALELNPRYADVLDLMATTILTGDSTVYAPETARGLAWRAVTCDKMQTPEYLHTLAWAYHECGPSDSALFWMRCAVAHKSSQQTAYESELAQWEAGSARKSRKGRKSGP
jgi:hypothetical protein